MVKVSPLPNITAGSTSAAKLNDAFTKIEDAFDNTLSLDGSAPNAMQVDLDMNGNDIVNVNGLYRNNINVLDALSSPVSEYPAYYAASIAVMVALTKASLTDGVGCMVASYHSGYNRGGGLFVWSASSTDTTDSATTFAANEGGTGRWKRVHTGILSLEDCGGKSGDASDQKSVVDIAIGLLNNNTAVRAITCDGVWNTSGGWASVTCNKKVMKAISFAFFTRVGNGTMLNSTGNYNVFENLWFDGGTYTGAVVKGQGLRNKYINLMVENGADAGYNLTTLSDEEQLIHCTAKDTGGTGMGLGGATAPLAIAPTVVNSGPEGIQGDELNEAVIIAPRTTNCGGVGGIAGNMASNSLIMGAFSKGNNSGIGFGNKGNVDTTGLAVVGAILGNNDNYGLRLRNYYRDCGVTAITKASPAVATFARVSITGITNANPCIVTAPTHGLSDGARRRINSVDGMTELNGGMYRMRVIDANTLVLQELEKDDYVNSTSYGVYSGNGKIDHAFEAEKGIIVFSSVGGMTQINGLELQPKALIGNDQISLTYYDETLGDVDSTTWTTYTTGGTAVSGSRNKNSVGVGIVTYGNGKGGVTVGDSLPQGGAANNMFTGIVVQDAGGENYGRQADSSIHNKHNTFYAALSSDVNNITGNSTFYNPLMPQVEDGYNLYDPATGVYTVPHGGYYIFEAAMGLGGMSTATDASITIKATDRNVDKVVFTQKMQPTAGDATASAWQGVCMTPVVYLEKGWKVFTRVQATGLAGDTADLKAGSWFSGVCVG